MPGDVPAAGGPRYLRIGRLERPVRRAATVLGPRAGAVPVGAALAAVGLALWEGGGPGWLVSLVWLVGFGWVVGIVVVASRQSGTVVIGEQVTARVLLLITAVGGGVRRAPLHRGVLWWAGAAVLLALLAESGVRRLRPQRDVSNLPGVSIHPAARPISWVVPVSLAVLAAIGAAALTHMALVLRLIPPIVGVAVTALALAAAAAAWRRRPARAARLTAALTAYAPAFAIYTGRLDGGVHQVAMWLPYLERLNRPYVVITRVPAAVAALARVTNAPIVARSSWRALDDVVVPSLEAAFYVNSAATNTNFISYRQLTHVYLGHGESDKSLSFHPSHAMFDRVFVAGQAAIDRYARNGVPMRGDAFVIVGRPQLDSVRPSAGPRGPVPTVLYAPTWAGYNAETSYSSLPHGVAVVQALLDSGAVVVFRPHPFSRRRGGERSAAAAVDAVLRADAARTGRAHRWGPEIDNGSFADSADLCDVMVSDLSSVIVDFLGSEKPMAIIASGASAAEFSRRHPVARGCYVVGADLADLPGVLEEMLGADPRRDARAQTRQYYLGGLSGPEAVATFTAAAAACLLPRRLPPARPVEPVESVPPTERARPVEPVRPAQRLG